jgi:hypothetical protein
MNKTVVAKVWSSDEDSCGVAWAILEIDPEQAWQMLRRMDLASVQKASDNSLYSLTFWDGRPTFVHYAGLPEELADQVEQEEVVVLAYPLEVSAEAVERVEYMQMVATPEDCYWEAYIKHTSVRLETAIFPRATLAELAQPAAGRQPAA